MCKTASARAGTHEIENTTGKKLGPSPVSSECLLVPSRAFMISDQRLEDQFVWSKVLLSCRRI